MIQMDTTSRKSGVADVNKNIMLYWDDANVPNDVMKVWERWKAYCPKWNVVLFDRKAAHRFLRDKYGRNIVNLFLTCAIPAMRADFFRVFWAISEGGIYSDISFVPKREPLFFDYRKDLTVARRSYTGIISGPGNRGFIIPRTGIIGNSIFFSKKDSKALKLIAHEITNSISNRRISRVYFATGPGAWTRSMLNMEKNLVNIINFEDLFRIFIQKSNYSSATRGTEKHWKQLQRKMNIYQDPRESSRRIPS